MMFYIHYIYTDEHQAIGCFNDSIHLSCNNGSLINVTRAYYGKYGQISPCTEECCAPHPDYDCTETVIQIKVAFRALAFK